MVAPRRRAPALHWPEARRGYGVDRVIVAQFAGEVSNAPSLWSFGRSGERLVSGHWGERFVRIAIAGANFRTAVVLAAKEPLLTDSWQNL
jgi:hypothetical protein